MNILNKVFFICGLLVINSCINLQFPTQKIETIETIFKEVISVLQTPLDPKTCLLNIQINTPVINKKSPTNNGLYTIESGKINDGSDKATLKYSYTNYTKNNEIIKLQQSKSSSLEYVNTFKNKNKNNTYSEEKSEEKSEVKGPLTINGTLNATMWNKANGSITIENSTLQISGRYDASLIFKNVKIVDQNSNCNQNSLKEGEIIFKSSENKKPLVFTKNSTKHNKILLEALLRKS